jgi:membrane-associated protease RseP (regulator of RpoE activity)
VRILPGVMRGGASRAWINGVLFLLTLVSTLFAGALYSDAVTGLRSGWDLVSPGFLLAGLPFAATLLSILTAHEFGHYFAARYHKVAVTLPYFIPMPLAFGTMGAFIRLKEPVPDRRKLFDIGVAGPLAGLVLAVPLYFYGLSTSRIGVLPPDSGGMVLGDSIFSYVVTLLTFGRVLPDLITGEDVLASPIFLAAWIGMLVTALNLLPVGQLDGGHTVFAMFGEGARFINRITVGLLAFFCAGQPGAGAAVAAGAWAGWLYGVVSLALSLDVCDRRAASPCAGRRNAPRPPPLVAGRAGDRHFYPHFRAGSDARTIKFTYLICEQSPCPTQPFNLFPCNK